MFHACTGVPSAYRMTLVQDVMGNCTSLDSHEGLSTQIELTCATSIRRQGAGSCWRARESAGTLCRNLQRAGEDYGRVFETVQGNSKEIQYHIKYLAVEFGRSTWGVI